MKRHAMRFLGLAAAAALMLVSATTRAEIATSVGDSTQILKYDNDGTLIGFDTTTDPVQGLAFGQAGNLLVLTKASDGEGTVSGTLGSAVDVGALGTNPSLAASPFGGFAFSAGGSNQIDRYDDQGNLTGFEVRTDPVQALAFGAAGNLLALTKGSDGTSTLSGLLNGPPSVNVGTLGDRPLLAVDALSGTIALSTDDSNRVNFYNSDGSSAGFTVYTEAVQALAYNEFGSLLALLGDVGGAGVIAGLPNNVTINVGTLGANASLAASFSAQSVPEPSTLLLSGLGVAGLAVVGRRRGRNRK